MIPKMFLVTLTTTSVDRSHNKVRINNYKTNTTANNADTPVVNFNKVYMEAISNVQPVYTGKINEN